MNVSTGPSLKVEDRHVDVDICDWLPACTVSVELRMHVGLCVHIQSCELVSLVNQTLFRSAGCIASPAAACGDAIHPALRKRVWFTRLVS